MKKIGSILCVFLNIICLISCTNNSNYKTEWGKNVTKPLYNEFEDNLIEPVMKRVRRKQTELGEDVITYVVSVTEFGAIPDSTEDATQAFNNAIRTAFNEYGGGVVYIPAGRYRLDGNIFMMANVTLRGEWQAPSEETIGEGTILEVYGGKNKDENNLPFISTADGSSVSYLTIYYPEQDINNPIPYPYTIANQGYLGFDIHHVTFVNSYLGIKIENHNWLYFHDLYMTALKTGVRNNGIYDIGKWENVNINPSYWAMFEPNINKNKLYEYTKSHATGVSVGRYDWIYMYDTHIEGMLKGIDINGVFNGILYDVTVSDSIYPLYVTFMCNIGTQITNSKFSAVTDNGIAAYFTTDSENGGSYESYTMFYDVTFESEGKIIVLDTKGMVSVQYGDFKKWNPNEYAIEINRGALIVDKSTFAQQNKHISLSERTVIAKITGNGNLDILNNALPSANIIIEADKPNIYAEKVSVELGNKITKIAATQNIFYAPDYGVSEDSADNTNALQFALTSTYEAGGGVVVLPAGNFVFRGYFVIPPGVELRGINASAKHFGAPKKGTVIETYYGKGDVNGIPFITLSKNAGINGLSIFYPEQAFYNPVEFSPTIYAPDSGTWIYNVTIVNGYNSIIIEGDDFHTDFIRGYSIKTFLEVDGANNGLIENSLVTIGDWQDGEKLNELGPKPDAWKKHPNMYGNGAFLINNATNLRMIQNFAFGFDTGLELTGKINNLLSYGTGIDASRNAIILKNSGNNNTFINSELVCVDNYIWATDKYSGTSDFVNTNNWMSNTGDMTLEGTGTVRLQLYKQMTGSVYLKKGNIIMEGLILHSPAAKVIIEDGVRGILYNPVGNMTFIDVVNNDDDFIVLNDSRGI